MTDELYYNYIEPFSAVFFALVIGVLSGFGWQYIGISLLDQSVIKAQFYSFVFASGLSILYSLEYVYKRNYKRQLEGENQ